MLADREKHDAEIVVGAGGGDLIHAGPLLDRQRALEQRLGFAVAAHHLIEIGELADGVGDIRVIRPVCLLVDAEHMLADLLRVRELALGLVDDAEIVEHEHEFAGIHALELLLDAGGARHVVLGFRVEALLQLGDADIVERVCDLRRCRRHTSSPGSSELAGGSRRPPRICPGRRANCRRIRAPADNSRGWCRRAGAPPVRASWLRSAPRRNCRWRKGAGSACWWPRCRCAGRRPEPRKQAAIETTSAKPIVFMSRGPFPGCKSAMRESL